MVMGVDDDLLTYVLYPDVDVYHMHTPDKDPYLDSLTFR